MSPKMMHKFLILPLCFYFSHMCPISDYTNNLIPQNVKKQSICLVNTNLTFEFPAYRYSTSTPSWINHGAINMVPKLYVIELYQKDNLDAVLFDLHVNSILQPRAAYLFITENVTEKFTKTLQKYYVARAATITNNTLYIFNSKSLKMSSVKKLNTAFWEEEIEFAPTSNMTLRVGYMKKPPFVTCPNCPTDKGIEISLFNMASKKMNLNLEYLQFRGTYWGDKSNGSYTFLLKDLFDRKYDVALGQIFDMYQNHFDFDLTSPHIIDPVQFVVPKAKRISHFNLFSYVLQRDVIIAYTSVVILLFLITYVSRWWKKKLGKCLELVQIMFESSFDMNRIKELPMRLLYGSVMFAFINFNTGLKCRLFWALTMDHYETQINSLEDIANSNLIPVFNNHTEDYFTRNNSVDRFLETKSLRTCDFDFSCVDVVAFHRNVTTFKLRKALQYYSPRKYVDKEGKALIHIIDYDVEKIHIRFFFVKGHPVFRKFAKYMAILIENGFSDILIKQQEEGNKIAQAKAEMNYREISVHKLKAVQLLNVFYFYIAGILLSLTVFCIELVW